jgi:sirohydrochlorin cobaltochelatase
MDDFSDATLVLVGHGSTLNADSAAPTYQQADELRRRGLFAQVLEGFWKEHPTIAGVLRGAFTPRVFIVPLFISEGYFTEQVIPRELGFCQNGESDFPRVQVRNGQRRHYCGPVGTHPSMTNVILARAHEVVAGHPPADGPTPAAGNVSLFVAGHGTGKNENSRKAIEQQVALIGAQGLFASTHAIFMEEEPRIGDCYRLATTRDVVVVPFFISDGLHSREDIPVLLGEPESEVQARLKAGQSTWLNPTERRGKRVWYARSIGSEPLLADVIMERVREAAGWPVD